MTEDNAPSSQREPLSALERPPKLKGGKLAALVFALWLPLPVVAIAVLAIAGMSLPLMAGVAFGSVLSLGLALAALKTR